MQVQRSTANVTQEVKDTESGVVLGIDCRKVAGSSTNALHCLINILASRSHHADGLSLLVGVQVIEHDCHTSGAFVVLVERHDSVFPVYTGNEDVGLLQPQWICLELVLTSIGVEDSFFGFG